jgi:hypothetical protein
MSEKRRCSILFHLLVPVGKWQTVMGSVSSSASFCNSTFHSRTRSIAAAPVGRDHQSCGFGVALLSHRGPPASDGVDGKACRVVIGTDTHPPDIVGEVIDAIGHAVRQGRIDEVVDIDLLGFTCRSPLPPIISATRAPLVSASSRPWAAAFRRTRKPATLHRSSERIARVARLNLFHVEALKLSAWIAALVCPRSSALSRSSRNYSIRCSILSATVGAESAATSACSSSTLRRMLGFAKSRRKSTSEGATSLGPLRPPQ